MLCYTGEATPITQVNPTTKPSTTVRPTEGGRSSPTSKGPTTGDATQLFIYLFIYSIPQMIKIKIINKYKNER